MPTKKNTKLSDGEWAIMRVVWRTQPVSAVSVKEEFESSTGWTYSTVKTMMDRMVRKDLLSTKRIRNLILYSAAITPDQARKGALKQVLDNAFEGALPPMIHFLLEHEDLSEKELNQLRELIDRHPAGENP